MGSVEAPLAAADLAVRPWRTATLVATLVAAVELVLLVIVGVHLLAKPVARALHHRAATAALSTPTATTKAIRTIKRHEERQLAVTPKLTRAQTGVLVLNGNGVAGAAGSEAARLSGLGYPITGTTNAQRHDYATTSVMYRPGYGPEADRLAHDLGLKAVGPLDGIRASALHGGKLVVIVGVG